MDIPENWRETLLDLAEIACVQHKIKETTLGNWIVNDADLFPDLRKGAGCGMDKCRKILTWFSKNIKKPKQALAPKRLKEREV